MSTTHGELHIPSANDVQARMEENLTFVFRDFPIGGTGARCSVKP
jgi:hypothetical protein